MIMQRVPLCLQAFFGPLRRRLSRPQFGHLWTLVVAWAVNMRQAKVTHLAALLAGRHRTARGRFLGQSDWNASDLLDRQALALLGRMHPRQGEVIYLILDDTRIAKRGRKMAGLSKIWDHACQRFVYGHMIVTAAILFRGVMLPWRFTVWQPRKQAGSHFRTLTELAAAMISEFAAPAGLKVRVLFDAFYLSPVVTKACLACGFHWFSVAARNRTVICEGKPRRRLADLAPGWLRHRARVVRLRRARGWAWMRIAVCDGHLSRIGMVRLVASRRRQAGRENVLVLATSDTGLDTRTIVSEYEKRWSIEVLFKELRGSLGLGDYQVQSEQAIRHHVHLTGLVHQVLTHHSLKAVGAKARKAKVDLTLPPLSQRLEALREHLRRERLARFLKRVRQPKLHRRFQQCLTELDLAA